MTFWGGTRLRPDCSGHRIGHRILALLDIRQQSFVDGRVQRWRFVLGKHFFEAGVATLRVIETAFRLPLLEAVIVGNRRAVKTRS